MMNLKVTIDELRKHGKIERVVDNYICDEIEKRSVQHAVKAEYSVTLADDTPVLTGSITGKIKLGCSRCLESFDYRLSLKINRAYQPEDKEIDAGDELRQIVILNLPDSPACKETCAGLCQSCGKNINLSPCGCDRSRGDPRWEKLLIKTNRRT